MTPETQGFAVGVLFCVALGFVFFVGALWSQSKRIDQFAAELDPDQARRDAEWDRIRLVLDEDDESVTVLPFLRPLPSQRTPGGAS